jgi:hypothetical protein
VLAGIDAVRRSVSLWRMGRGYLILCLIAVGLVFAGVLADHSFVLQRTGRLAFFRTLVLACGAGLLLASLHPVARRVGRLYVARKVEDSRPALRNALISYVQVRDDPSVPVGAKALLARRAAPHLRGLSARVAIDLRIHRRLAAAVCVVLLAFLAYGVATPKSSLVSVARLLLPNADILPPTATRIVDIRPGDVYAVSGQRPQLQVAVRGVRPDQVYAVWSGVSYAKRRIPLTESQPGAWQGRFPVVLEDGTYYVVAGDTRSERYRVTLVPKPLIETIELEIESPAYTGLPTALVNGGDLDVVRGSTVHVRARTSLPPTRGAVHFGSGGRTLLMCATDEQMLTGKFTVWQSDTYSIQFEGAACPACDTLRNTSPIEYAIRCREDLPPVLTVHGPPDRTEALPDDTVNITYSVSDDFGLTEVRLLHVSGGFISQPLVLARNPGRKLTRVDWAWDLATTGVSPGRELAYYVEAEDNYQAAHHVTRSERRTILIVGEAPSPEPAEARPHRAGPRVPPRPGGRPAPRPADLEWPDDLDGGDDEPAQEAVDAQPDQDESTPGVPAPSVDRDDSDTEPAQDGDDALPAEGEEPASPEGQPVPQRGSGDYRGGVERPAVAGAAPSDSQGRAGTSPAGAGVGADATGVRPEPPDAAGPGRSALIGRHVGPDEEAGDTAQAADDAAREMLRELGVDHEQLREYVERYKERARLVVEAETDPRPLRPRGVDQQARVLAAARAAAGLSAPDWTGPAPPPDNLRIRFEGARERLSPAYRDIVDRYFVALSEGP